MTKRLLAALVAVLYAIPAQAQLSFKNVETRTTYGTAKQGDKGKLVIDNKLIRFTTNKGAVYFSVPPKAVTDLFYSRVSGRRIGAAIVVSPLLLFSKGRKHYVTVSFNDGADLVGAVEFKLHKSNYRGVLRTLEQVTNQTMHYDQEGVKDIKQTVATRGKVKPDETQGVVKITSNPEGAEVNIDGAYAGLTPRSRPLAPGEYKLKLQKKGYKDWERKIVIGAGETLEVSAEMEQKGSAK